MLVDSIRCKEEVSNVVLIDKVVAAVELLDRYSARGGEGGIQAIVTLNRKHSQHSTIYISP